MPTVSSCCAEANDSNISKLVVYQLGYNNDEAHHK